MRLLRSGAALVDALDAVQVLSEADALRNSVRAQYTAGYVGESQVEDYRNTPDVKPDSIIETYVALKLMIESWRWAGVPFYLRTGKALKAHDQLKTSGISTRVIDLYSVAPVDRTTLVESARATGGKVLTVEDHYEHGGIGDAVLSALASEPVRLHKLAVREIPHSGKPEELIDHYGIGVRTIVQTAKQIIA